MKFTHCLRGPGSKDGGCQRAVVIDCSSLKEGGGSRTYVERVITEITLRLSHFLPTGQFIGLSGSFSLAQFISFGFFVFLSTDPVSRAEMSRNGVGEGHGEL